MRRAAFAGIAALAFAAASFWATRVFIASPDTILRFVPPTAALYVHESGDDVLISALRIPALHPDEAAVFAVPTTDGIHWSTLLRWRMRPLAADEIAALADHGAVALGRRTFLLGDASSAHGASLADAPRAASALVAMRGVANIQLYANPSAFPAVRDDVPVTPAPLEPFVAAIAVHPSSMTIAAASAREAATMRLFGFAMPTEQRPLPSSNRSSADLSLVETTPSFDPLVVLFGQISELSPAAPASRIVGDAALALRTLLDAPLSVALFPSENGDRVDFLFRLPTVRTGAATTALQNYFAAAWPDATPFRLPDGDMASEYRFNKNSHRFAPVADANGAERVAFSGNSSIIVSTDGADGTLIASDPRLLSMTKAKQPGNQPCDSAAGTDRLTLTLPPAFAAALPLISGALPIPTLSTLSVVNFGDRAILACGY